MYIRLRPRFHLARLRKSAGLALFRTSCHSTHLCYGISLLQASLPGQSHLNSDATIAHEGRPQGAPLPDSGSLTRFFSNLMQLPWQASLVRQVPPEMSE